MKYRIKDISRAADPTVQVGDIVVKCKMHDYGLASDDTRITGIEHVSVTKDPEGGWPSFTIPKAHLEQL